MFQMHHHFILHHRNWIGDLYRFEVVLELEFLVHKTLALWQMARLYILRDACYYD